MVQSRSSECLRSGCCDDWTDVQMPTTPSQREFGNHQTSDRMDPALTEPPTTPTCNNNNNNTCSSSSSKSGCNSNSNSRNSSTVVITYCCSSHSSSSCCCQCCCCRGVWNSESSRWNWKSVPCHDEKHNMHAATAQRKYRTHTSQGNRLAWIAFTQRTYNSRHGTY